MQTANSAASKNNFFHTNLRDIFGAFCVEIFKHRQIIVESVSHSVEHTAIHKSIKTYIKNVMDDEIAMLSSRENLEELTYLMCAMADEIFLNIDWSGKEYWESDMLEQNFFGTQFAGEAVFRKISELFREKDPISVEKAEIYLKALSLGFKGKYRDWDNEQSEINEVRQKLFDFIVKHDKSVTTSEYRLFQREYAYTIPTIHRKMLPDISIINYLAAFFVFMLLVISTIVWLLETKDIRRLANEICSIAMLGNN